MRLTSLLQVPGERGATAQFQAEAQVVVAQPLCSNPANQLREDRLRRLSSLDGGGATHGAAYTLGPLFAILRRDQTPTIGAMWKLVLVLFAVLRPPLIYQVFAHQWLTTVGAARRDAIAVTLKMIGRTLVHLKTRARDWPSTRCAHEMLGMPRGPERGKIVAPDELTTAFTDRLH
ncbi:MAG TPA: hypothetical protein VEL31_22865 [Ktedonobacteraceae bacterium]|nr:hypothetical protein [Ktedonobacteraceae bacterium]